MAIGDDVWAIAQTKIGDPYVFGADGPNSFDCSGLTRYCWQVATHGHINLVHHAFTQFHNIPRVPGGWAAAKAGDLVFFAYGNDCPPNCPGHVAIAQGDGTHLISATNPGTGVEYTTLAGLGGIGDVMGVGRPLDGPGGGGGGGNCGDGGILDAATWALSVGLTHDQAIISVAIAGAESGYDLHAENPPCCFGPWQINILVNPYTKEYVETWGGASTAMFAISAGGTDWTPWSTYNSGAYLHHIAEATKVVECVIGSGGGGGGSKHGTPIPLALSRKFDATHHRNNLTAIEVWSREVVAQAKSLQPLVFAGHRTFDASPYRFCLRLLQDFLDSTCGVMGLQTLRLYQPFDETNWKRNVGLLTDFADQMGSGAPPPPPPPPGGGGGGPTFGIDRQANQSVILTGLDFVILRASFGLTEDSPSWRAARFAEAVAAGKEVIFYHFGRGPGHSGGSGAAEADFFVSCVEHTVGVGNAPLYGTAYDWEPFEGYTTPQSNVEEFLGRMGSAHGCLIGLYTFWFFHQNGYPYDIGQNWYWVSYVVHPNHRPPGKFDIWQYDVAERFGSLTDLDQSDMSIANLRARIHH